MMQRYLAALLAHTLALSPLSAMAEAVPPPRMMPSGANAVLPDARNNLGLGTASDVTFSSLTVGGGLNLSAAKAFPTSVAPLLLGNWSVSGAPTTGPAALGNINVADNIDASGTGNALSMLYLLNVPGTSAKGQRNTLQTQIALTNPTADGQNNNFYTANTIFATATANQGGTAPAASANLVGQSIETTLYSGATFFNLAQGAEYGVDIQAGASAAFVNTLKLSPGGCGSHTCAGLNFGGNLTDAKRYKTVISLAAEESGAGAPAVATDGTLIGASIRGWWWPRLMPPRASI